MKGPKAFSCGGRPDRPDSLCEARGTAGNLRQCQRLLAKGSLRLRRGGDSTGRPAQALPAPRRSVGSGGSPAVRYPAQKNPLRSYTVVVLIVLLGLSLGSSSPHAADPPERLWTSGFATPPAPGDQAVPQPMPSRKLRANEDPAEQTKLRYMAESTAAYSRVDGRDGGNGIDCFPGDHPPVLNVIAHGPASLGPASPGGRLVSLATRRGAAEKMLRSRGCLRRRSSAKWRTFAAARGCRQTRERPPRRPRACWRRP